MAQLLMEEKPEWERILRLLEANGATRPGGWRIGQQDFADQIGLNRKQLAVYIKQMEGYGLLTIRRTTVDGSFGSPRGFNLYRLLVTWDGWVKVAPEFIARRRDLVSARLSSKARNRESEKKRQAAPKVARKDKPVSRAVVLDPETVAVLAARYDDELDSELDGW